MSKLQPFSASQFKPTKWDSADDKAKFANWFANFIAQGCPSGLWHKWFYKRLSMCFMHIAHYDQGGFWCEWFDTDQKKQEFMRHTLSYPAQFMGDPGWTYSDVEKAIIQWCRESGWADRYERGLFTAAPPPPPARSVIRIYKPEPEPAQLDLFEQAA